MITGASQVANALLGGADAINHLSRWMVSASIGMRIQTFSDRTRRSRIALPPTTALS